MKLCIWADIVPATAEIAILNAAITMATALRTNPTAITTIRVALL